MTLGPRASCAAKQPHQAVPGVDGANNRARLIGPAGAVHFAGGNAGNPYLRAFGAPHRAIAIPNRDGRAGEGLPRGDDLKQA